MIINQLEQLIPLLLMDIPILVILQMNNPEFHIMYNSTSSRTDGLQNIGYTFSKNGKYFAVWGTSDDDMLTIMRTIS